MSLVANPDDVPLTGPASTATPVGRSVDRSTPWVLVVAAIPAVVMGVLIRVWVMHSPLLSLNADEAITGLQALEVLNGRFRLVVAGNQYGSTTESYLFAPLLAVWSGPWPLRVGATLLSVAAAGALFCLARPFVGRTVALVVGLVGWTTSGIVVVVWSHSYMGYTTGFIAQVLALALACRAMRTTEHLPRTAFFGGVAAGIAIWSHPMFGMMSLLALIAPTLLRWRSLRSWWLPVVAGGGIGVSPWLVYIARNGVPSGPHVESTYTERLSNFFVELMPRVFGVRSPSGDWLNPTWLSVSVVAIVVPLALAGLVLLVIKCGIAATPIAVSGLLAFPALALFPPLAFFADGRYGLPFLPLLLLGISAWSLLLPRRVSSSPWMVLVIPTIWSLALCVPIVHHQIGWTMTNPTRRQKSYCRLFVQEMCTIWRVNIGASTLIDYLGDGTLEVRPDAVVRFPEEARVVDAAKPDKIAFIYSSGLTPVLTQPVDHYDLVSAGGYLLYLPKDR